MVDDLRREVPAPTRRLGLRLALAGLAALLVAVPFTLLALLVRSRAGWLTRLDTGVAESLSTLMNGQSWLVRTMRVIGWLSEPFVLRAVALVIVVLLWRRGRRRVAIWLAVTMAVGGVLGVLLKLIVARARPELDAPVAAAGGYSFPSGHALNAMVFACCVLVLAHPRTGGPTRGYAWLGAVVFVLLVGFDRISLGVHYLSDVVAGYAVGAAVAVATVAAFRIWQREERVPAASTEAGLDPAEERQ
jgi:membrane-associated phospholipid phosphatase